MTMFMVVNYEITVRFWKWENNYYVWKMNVKNFKRSYIRDKEDIRLNVNGKKRETELRR